MNSKGNVEIPISAVEAFSIEDQGQTCLLRLRHEDGPAIILSFPTGVLDAAIPHLSIAVAEAHRESGKDAWSAYAPVQSCDVDSGDDGLVFVSFSLSQSALEYRVLLTQADAKQLAAALQSA